MGMMTGGSNQAQINITPMIDILLVLLIIFMVIQPARNVGLQAALPQDGESNAAPVQPPIVIQVEHDGRARVNSEEMALGELGARLTSIFHGHPASVAFVDGAGDLEYGEVARVIDIAKGAGVGTVGLMPKRH
jgi:biopolymer transport protein ExbD